MLGSMCSSKVDAETTSDSKVGGKAMSMDMSCGSEAVKLVNVGGRMVILVMAPPESVSCCKWDGAAAYMRSKGIG